MKQALVLLCAALLIAACGTINMPAQTPTQTGSYRLGIEGISEAAVTIRSIAESLYITPLAESDNLLEGELEYFGTILFDTDDSQGTYAVNMTESFNGSVTTTGEVRWDVGLTTVIPLSLNLRTSSGNMNLDLSTFDLSAVQLESTSGSVDVRLPAVTESLPVAFTTSSGSVTVHTAEASQLDLTGRTTSGAITIELPQNASGTISLASSSGSITVNVPDDAAIRLEIQSNSSGSVSVLNGMVQTSGDERTGIWETANYADAAQQISIIITSSSSGAVTVR